VNILKDVAVDAEKENSVYVPEELLRAQGSSQSSILAPELLAKNREALTQLIQLAWHDLEEARTYLLLIPRRAISIRLFCILPLLLAYATLRDLVQAFDGVAISSVSVQPVGLAHAYLEVMQTEAASARA
jgi:farnesyl-diphosphate farnesyltransferase